MIAAPRKPAAISWQLKGVRKMSRFSEMIEKMESAGYGYSGESTMYSRFIEWGTIAGVEGKWIHAEFGGVVFNPRGSLSCFSKVSA